MKHLYLRYDCFNIVITFCPTCKALYINLIIILYPQSEITESKDKDISHYPLEHGEMDEVVIGLWHASPGMGEQPAFLGEVRVTLRGLEKQPSSTATAWYILPPLLLKLYRY